MVVGVIGYMVHVVSHVMMEYKNVIEYVTILHHCVEEINVWAQVMKQLHATTIAVLVRIYRVYIHSYLCSYGFPSKNQPSVHTSYFAWLMTCKIYL